MTKTEKIFLITIIILLLQITRNISILIYCGILFSSYGYLYIVYLHSHKQIEADYSKKKISVAKLVFILTLLWIPMISLTNLSFGDYFVGFGRYLVTLPFILFCIIYNGYSPELIQKVLRTLVVFMVIASLSVPFQIMFGEISFFADSSYREELIRYASLAGSLTALGTLGSYGLAILLFSEDFLFVRRYRVIFMIVIIGGMLMSLQKAAIVNIMVVFALYIIANKAIKIERKIVGIIVLVGIVILIYVAIKDTMVGEYIGAIFRYSFKDSSTGFKSDFIVRLWELPKRVMLFHELTIPKCFIGIGFSSLAGTLGLSKFPMSHNNYFDLIFSGGIFHFLAYLYLAIRIPVKTGLKKINYQKINFIDRLYSVIIILMLINMTSGGATFYQPLSAVFIFFPIFSYNKARLYDWDRLKLEQKRN